MSAFHDFETYKKGEVLFREGEYQDWMFEIKEGRVRIYTAYGTSEEQFLTELTAGGFVGELGLVYAAPRSATAVASTDVALARVTGENFSDYFRDEPAKVLQIMQQMSMRLRELTDDYMEACHTIQELTESGGKTEGKPGLMSRVKRFASVYKNR